MTKKKEKRTSLFGRPRKVVENRNFDIEPDDYQEEFEESTMLRKIVKYSAYALILVLLGIYITKRDKIQQIRSDQLTQKQQTQATQLDLGEAYGQFRRLQRQAELAYEEGDYMLAVYNYRQALTYGGTDVKTYERLILALEKSCEAGEETHCNAIERTQKRMEWVKENVVEKEN
ncbi:MAG: hypothetical protein AAGG75_14640 [Bacteroidota bacterium]